MRKRDPNRERGSIALPSRSARRVYTFSETHLSLLVELDRLLPKSAPVVDFEAVPPGVESIESVSVRLLERYLELGEQAVCFAFCRLNSDRLLDHIEDELLRLALPLQPAEILLDSYARLFYDADRGEPGRREIEQQLATRRGDVLAAPVWTMLVAAVAEVIGEERSELERMELPLPGLPLPVTESGEAARSMCARVLDEHEVQLSELEARRWVTYSLLQLPLELRRAYLLREVQGLELAEVASTLGITPFTAAQQVRDAHRGIADRLQWLVRVFAKDEDDPRGSGEEAARHSGETESPGSEDDHD